MSAFPTISDADVQWVCKVMGLPDDAFLGEDGKDPRQGVLKRMDTIDVEACPGSGKTTLLVAKLAVLARHWPFMRSGMCVLSHTNAARDEIARRLSSCAEGAMLMGYPHFVGTIHGFINEFLALPYLRSLGNPIKFIDNDVVIQRRWHSLERGTRHYLDKQNNGDGKAFLRYDADDFTGEKMRGKFKSHTNTFKHIQKACKDSFEEGYFCFDELFVWARKIINERPSLVRDLRLRFPLLFLDEVQDNDEDQSSLLSTVFREGANPAVRQRFGDSNQAIYNGGNVTSGAATDIFPGRGIIKVDLPNSFRFGPAIAGLADPLAVAPQGLIGLGGGKPRPPTIILFNDSTVQTVLSEYATYLTEIFTAKELEAGTFTAVAGVHKRGADDKIPRWLGHYAPSYNPDISSREAKPECFSQFIMAGWRESERQKHTQPLVHAVGTAMLEVLRRDGFDGIPAKVRNPHSTVMGLTESEEAIQQYKRLLDYLIRKAGTVTQTTWNTKLSAAIKTIAENLRGSTIVQPEAISFLNWSLSGALPTRASVSAGANVFKYPSDNPAVSIRLGSIHSVKGETHNATLVMETFYKKHYLKSLLPWILGTSTGGASEGVEKKRALRLHYVAMTRPSELLCLAMRDDSLGARDIVALKKRGWVIRPCPAPAANKSATAS